MLFFFLIKDGYTVLILYSMHRVSSEGFRLKHNSWDALFASESVQKQLIARSFDFEALSVEQVHLRSGQNSIESAERIELKLQKSLTIQLRKKMPRATSHTN